MIHNSFSEKAASVWKNNWSCIVWDSYLVLWIILLNGTFYILLLIFESFKIYSFWPMEKASHSITSLHISVYVHTRIHSKSIYHNTHIYIYFNILPEAKPQGKSSCLLDSSLCLWQMFLIKQMQRVKQQFCWSQSGFCHSFLVGPVLHSSLCPDRINRNVNITSFPRGFGFSVNIKSSVTQPSRPAECC